MQSLFWVGLGIVVLMVLFKVTYWVSLLFLLWLVFYYITSKKESYGVPGRPYGINYLYSNTNATVPMPTSYDVAMNGCRDGVFNYIRYIPPNNFLNTHLAQATEQGWNLQNCAVTSTKPYAPFVSM